VGAVRSMNGMLPPCLSHLAPIVSGDTPTAIPACSLVTPRAISRKYAATVYRRAMFGRPTDPNGGRTPRRHRPCLMVAMLHPPAGRVLQGPIEFTQYAAGDYRKVLSARSITVSMSRKGNCRDNAPMESANGTAKLEACTGPASRRGPRRRRRYWRTSATTTPSGFILRWAI